MSTTLMTSLILLHDVADFSPFGGHFWIAEFYQDKAHNDVLHRPVPVVTSHHSEGPIQSKQGFVAEEVVGTLLDGNLQSIEEEKK